MTESRGSTSSATRSERCDSRIWSGACERDDYATLSEKYLCQSCGTIAGLSHEMHGEGYPHIVGDEGDLS